MTCTMAPILTSLYVSVPLASAWLLCTGSQRPGTEALPVAHQAHTLPFPWEPWRPWPSPPAAQPQLPQGQGTSPPPLISSSSSRGLSGSGREGISRPKPPSWPSAVSLVSLASPGGVQEVLQCSGVRAKTSPVSEVRNEASTLGTPVLALPIPSLPVAGPSQASRSLGWNSHSSSCPICWQGKAFFPCSC